MNIQVVRENYTPHTTTGKLYIDGEYFCYTLEDTVRGEGIKVRGWTAIPEGCYKVGIRYSPRFKRKMLSIYTENDGETIKLGGVTFKYVMAHGGNKHENTEGCPLVAYNKISDEHIYGTAEKGLFNKVEAEIAAGNDVTWEVINTSQDN